MQPERWQAIREVFEHVVDLDSGQVPAYLDQACRNDPELRAEVESLLAAHRSAGDFIETPPGLARNLLENERTDPLIGSQLGPYRVVREIARGGMGVVYQAARADDQYSKLVAIKVVHAGLDSAAVSGRFRTERQILANLDHSNIARLLDGGTAPDGRSFFVMEFVDGLPIDEYCRSGKLPLDARLRLFQDVCRAVHHAHRHLIIHRDIKPTNVLVTSEGVPKLLDFGIAKLLDGAAPGLEPNLTIDVPMTPQYASPEQIRGEPITTATDVYSLGVLLFELLTGRTPYPMSSDRPADLREAICDREPPKPSTAMRRAPDEDGREGAPGRKLEGDVDNIILKALRKDPGRRYSSAMELADDLERHLQSRPVAARPDTVWYRSAKFVRRHKTGVLMAAFAVVLLAAAFIITAFQYRAAELERRRAERRYNEVRQLATTFLFDVHDSISSLPGSTSVRQKLVETALKYLDNLSRESKGDRALQRELATAYDRVARVQYAAGEANVGNVEAAAENRRKALALRESLALENPADTEATLDWAESLADAIARGYAPSDPVGLARKALELVETVNAKTPSERSRRVMANACYSLGSAYIGAGKAEESLGAFTRAAGIFEALVRDVPRNDSYRFDFALTNKRIGALLGTGGREQEAFVRYRKALEIEENLSRLDPNDVNRRRAVSVTYSDLGWLLARTGNPKAALESYGKALEIRRELAAADPANMDMQYMLASTLARMGSVEQGQKNWREAGSLYRQVLALREEIVRKAPSIPKAQSDLAASYSDLAGVFGNEGRYSEAIQYREKALAIHRDLAGRSPADRKRRANVGWASGDLGATLHEFVALHPQMSAAERCRMLLRSQTLLNDGVALLLQMNGRGELLKNEGATIGRYQHELEQNETALSRLRAAGSCRNPE